MRTLLFTLLVACAAGCAARKPQAVPQVDMREREKALHWGFPSDSPTVAAQPQNRQSRTVTSRSEPVLVTPSTALIGKIVRSNKNGRFVVVSFSIGQMAAQEQRLSVYRGGVKVGEIKISGQPRDDMIAADIMAGEAEVGDQVRDR